jgi:ABC-2 type transport system permease protein
MARNTSMRKIAVLVKKELWESFGDRSSRRGGFIQAAVLVVGLGFLTPRADVPGWLTGAPLSIAFFAFIPGVAAASMAADAFAGERERRTLETLLATPVSEAVLLAGKALASIVFGSAVGILGLVAATGTIRSIADVAFLPSLTQILGALGATLASSSAMAAAAIVVSMLVPVARATQQIISVGTMFVYAALAVTWGALHLAVTWRNVFLAEAAMVVLAIGALGIARALFRRERFFTTT